MCESGLNDGKVTYEKHVEGTGFTLGDKPLNVERDTVLAVVRGIVYTNPILGLQVRLLCAGPVAY